MPILSNPRHYGNVSESTSWLNCNQCNWRQRQHVAKFVINDSIVEAGMGCGASAESGSFPY